jgi:hypothetical protein
MVRNTYFSVFEFKTFGIFIAEYNRELSIIDRVLIGWKTTVDKKILQLFINDR